MKQKKLLITGGAGFIGSNIIEHLLNKNNMVTCLDNFLTGKKENVKGFLNNPNFKMVEGDITNLEDCLKACKDIDVILHQAALGSVPRSIEDPLKTNNINITGFLNVLWAAKEHNLWRLKKTS